MMRNRRHHRRGYVLPAVLLFLMISFGIWAVFFRSTASVVRIEQARVLRETRTVWDAPAVATGLRLLQTGLPPHDPYSCRVTLTNDSQTKYILLKFEKVAPVRWSITASPTTADDLSPDVPTTFAAPPIAPTGMTATAISNAQIDLAWDDVPYDNGYKIERSPDGTSGWTQIATTAKNVTIYSNTTSLSEATTYYYRVRGTNSEGDGAYSGVASATTLTAPPMAPTGLGATAVASTEIDLAWTDNASNETGFKIERSPDGSTWSPLTTLGANVTSYNDTSLTASTTHYYRVYATNSGGDSSYSNTANATTPPPAPNAPTGLNVTPVSGSEIDLSWTDTSNNETGFKIERSPDGSAWTQIATVGANIQTYQNTGLSAGTTYYYRVKAYNAGGDTAYTNTANTPTYPPPPGVPTALTATAASSSQINLGWTDNASTEDGFKIERSPNGSTSWTQIATVGVNVQAYNDSTGLSANTIYYYRVRAYNTGGTSAYTSNANATTLPLPPAAPSGLTATAANSSTINLSWTDNSNNETGFKVERSPDNSTWSLITTAGANVTSYSNTGLAATTKYYYRVRATNTGGDSSNSTANATTTAIPAPPSGLGATKLSNTSIRLNWTDNSNNETGFRVQRSTNGTTWSTITTTAAGATTYTNTGLTHGQIYYYRVKALGAAGNSAYTSVVNITP